MVLTSYNVGSFHGSFQAGSTAFVWNYNNVGGWPDMPSSSMRTRSTVTPARSNVQIGILAYFVFELTAIATDYIGGIAKDNEGKLAYLASGPVAHAQYTVRIVLRTPEFSTVCAISVSRVNVNFRSLANFHTRQLKPYPFPRALEKWLIPPWIPLQ